jgi:hypothetical protein
MPSLEFKDWQMWWLWDWRKGSILKWSGKGQLFTSLGHSVPVGTLLISESQKRNNDSLDFDSLLWFFGGCLSHPCWKDQKLHYQATETKVVLLLLWFLWKCYCVWITVTWVWMGVEHGHTHPHIHPHSISLPWIHDTWHSRFPVEDRLRDVRIQPEIPQQSKVQAEIRKQVCWISPSGLNTSLRVAHPAGHTIQQSQQGINLVRDTSNFNNMN